MWGTSGDNILVVGVHWDTVRNTGGLDDNGSGMSALLELARVLNHGKCVAKFTIILVAFDLEESASQGSLVFVQDFLLGSLLKSTGAKTQGAIILDSILHFNDTEGSQSMGKEWGRLVPEAVEKINTNEGKLQTLFNNYSTIFFSRQRRFSSFDSKKSFW